MDKTRFLTIFPSYENLEIVRQTLPSVIAETKANDARLIVHDSSENGREEKWCFLRELNHTNDFFLLLSNNLSMAHSRNLCLHLGQEMYAPDYICMIEDDHGFRPGLISELVTVMQRYYGSICPNGLRYGLFTACGAHNTRKRQITADGHGYPDADAPPGQLGKANSCFRCAPTSHWNNVLKGYDTDEYLLSTFQTRNLNLRNYNKGFTTLILENGARCFHVENQGRGTSSNLDLKPWDENFTASDSRSRYSGKASREHSPRETDDHDQR